MEKFFILLKIALLVIKIASRERRDHLPILGVRNREGMLERRK